MGGIEIKVATGADVVALARLMAELGYPTSPGEMAARLERLSGREEYATFVADENGSLAGMIGLSLSPTLYRDDLDGAIVALVVSSNFRGRGIGGLLIDHGERWLYDRGARLVTVKPSARRDDAHRLYKRCGYEHTGLRFTKVLEGLGG
ncbi:GNAT family N-acetyltransferase [Rhizobium jaguaris]|uniref:GNAT family N-acetyltransferase n=1 Tax=Rhizobium jaguaris TaxID=1312183 RepID=A0A387FQQ8_9HYPH|nr:GNAT family N-acetyltransferase [Rhizobium jaguaris]AYG60753.1 GNAT family N-acetyltransferase [Rhizobium jaguaris]